MQDAPGEAPLVAAAPADPAGADAVDPTAAFPATKRGILLLLKREGEMDLATLGRRLGVSKMAIHRHIVSLEARGLVERVRGVAGVGRPRLVVRLTQASATLFPQAYAGLTCSALRFIEDRLGRPAVEEALRIRQKEVRDAYRTKVTAEDLWGRVRQLTELRDSEGYMAEAAKAPGGTFQILEHNCPVLEVAGRYQEACTVERDLFRRVLGAEVETSHRVVAGDHVCRFLVKRRRDRNTEL